MDRCETFRNCRTTIPLWLLKVSHLYTIPCSFYESPNEQNRMCELCTFSQIRSHIYMCVYIYVYLYMCIYMCVYICVYIYVRYSSFLTSCSRAPICEWVPVFLVHSIKTCMFNHSTRVFKFVFDRYRFTSVRSSSNSSGTYCEYVMSSDSSLRVHTSSSCALLEQ